MTDIKDQILFIEWLLQRSERIILWDNWSFANSEHVREGLEGVLATLKWLEQEAT